MIITERQLRKLIRENISSMLGSMQWTTWKTFEEVYNGLNDKFRQDMDECLREDMIGEEWIDSVELLDEIYEGDDLEDKLYELASVKRWDWEADVFRKYRELHTPDRIMIALWFISEKKADLTAFAFQLKDDEEIYAIAEQCYKVVDMYGLVPSFKDQIQRSAHEANSMYRTDRAVGVVQMRSFAE